MNYLYCILRQEIFKIGHRKWQLAMLFFTLLGFPFFMWATSLLEAKASPMQEELFLSNMVGFTIKMSLSVACISLWIAVFVGQEFSSNYVNKAVFLTSRKEYFISKIIYCFIVASLFLVVDLISLAVSLNGGLFQSMTQSSFIFWFIPHVFIVNIFYCLIFLCVTFALRSPKVSLVVVYCLPGLDILLFKIFDMAFHIKLNGLPFKLLHSMYLRDGYRPDSFQYYNPLREGDFLLFMCPTALVTGLCFLSYKWFLVRDLKTMSD